MSKCSVIVKVLDAFYDVRNLIDEEQGLISKVDYEEMRTSKEYLYVGLVKSNKPWCFLVIQTNKNWAPQWVYLDFRKKAAKDGYGILICHKFVLI